jgi:hypothetical protein
MDRHFFIVARGEVGLCNYLQRGFSSEEGVQVILDRRSGRDRRIALHPAGAIAEDRRSADRRTRAFVAAQLRSLGYAMLRVG